jgi:hypothetical protein
MLGEAELERQLQPQSEDGAVHLADQVEHIQPGGSVANRAGPALAGLLGRSERLGQEEVDRSPSLWIGTRGAWNGAALRRWSLAGTPNKGSGGPFVRRTSVG